MGKPVVFMEWNIWEKIPKSKVGTEKLNTLATVQALTIPKKTRAPAAATQAYTFFSLYRAPRARPCPFQPHRP